MVVVAAMSKDENENDQNEKKCLHAIDDEECAETKIALSSIRSNLCKSEKIITKHESQHSMTTIVDLVKKTKENMESQSIALTLLNDNEDFMSSEDASSQSSPCLSVDDSFSDHLGLIEDMLRTQKAAIENEEK